MIQDSKKFLNGIFKKASKPLIFTRLYNQNKQFHFWPLRAVFSREGLLSGIYGTLIKLAYQMILKKLTSQNIYKVKRISNIIIYKENYTISGNEYKNLQLFIIN